MAQLLDHQAKAEIASSLTELLRTIDEYPRLGANWDGEGALAVQPKTAVRAKSLLRQIAEKALLEGIPWQPPAVAPNPEGGLELTWEKGDRWTMLVVQPEQARVGCAAQEGGAEPDYQVRSRGEAVEKALWALRGEE